MRVRSWTASPKVRVWTCNQVSKERNHCIDSVYGWMRFKRANRCISMYFHQTVHQTLTKPYTLFPIGPTVSSFVYREPVEPNQYSGNCTLQVQQSFASVLI